MSVCIAVSKFQTESRDEIVSTETKVGDEDIVTPKTLQQRTSQISRWSGDKPVKQIVWEAVQELTGGNTNIEFAIRDIKPVILKKHPDFNMGNLGPEIAAGCVNHPSRRYHSVTDDLYSRISRGKYRLYDPEKDK